MSSEAQNPDTNAPAQDTVADPNAPAQDTVADPNAPAQAPAADTSAPAQPNQDIVKAQNQINELKRAKQQTPWTKQRRAEESKPSLTEDRAALILEFEQ
jgi:hypothetical protein